MDRQTFVFLDGIRGLAAILVVMTHADQFFDMWPQHTYLAVDVFFILSGFVIALAYEKKLISGDLSFVGFVKKRFIRLYPAYILSLALAFLLVVLGGYLAGESLLLWAGLSATLTAVMVPRLSGVMLFTLNPPYWSLFYEFIVNFIYAAVAPFLTTRSLVLILIGSGSILFLSSYMNGHLNSGWGDTQLHFSTGLSRSVFGILMGVFIFRVRPLIINKASFISHWVAVAVIITALLYPKIPGYDYLYDILVVTLVFPVCILIASQLKKTKLDPVMLLLGAASYPLYVLHYPIAKFITNVADSSGYGHIIIDYAPFTGIALIVFLLVTSLAMAKYIETPLRAWLTDLNKPSFPAEIAPAKSS